MKLSPQAESVYRVQSYGGAGEIDGVRIVELRRFNEAGGAMTELMRLGGKAPARSGGLRAGAVELLDGRAPV